MAEMEGRVDSHVTGRFGQSGKRLTPGQSVAEWAQQWPCRGSLRRHLSVEAVAAEAEVWLRVVLSWKRQAWAQHCQQPDSCSSYTDSSRTQHGGGELSKSPLSHTHSHRVRGRGFWIIQWFPYIDGKDKVAKVSCWWLVVFLTRSLFSPPVCSQPCLSSLNVSCALREWIRVTGTILLTPSFPFPWQPHPPPVSSTLLTLPLATSTSPLPLILSMVTALTPISVRYTSQAHTR